jgi:hypothetical protein
VKGQAVGVVDLDHEGLDVPGVGRAHVRRVHERELRPPGRLALRRRWFFAAQ